MTRMAAGWPMLCGSPSPGSGLPGLLDLACPVAKVLLDRKAAHRVADDELGAQCHRLRRAVALAIEPFEQNRRSDSPGLSRGLVNRGERLREDRHPRSVIERDD